MKLIPHHFIIEDKFPFFSFTGSNHRNDFFIRVKKKLFIVSKPENFRPVLLAFFYFILKFDLFFVQNV